MAKPAHFTPQKGVKNIVRPIGGPALPSSGGIARETKEMFESLSDRLSSAFDKITGRGALSESDVKTAMREVRRALLEADVALEVTKDFIDKVTEKAIGADVLKSVKPGQQVIKIVHDELVAMLGSEAEPINLTAVAPVPIMMVGLQGSGKTTTTGKIAKRLKEQQNKKILMASLDTRRPAAQEQLRVLGEQIDVATLDIVAGQTPPQIAERAIDEAKRGGFDVVMLDTAGRLHIDDELMLETEQIRDIAVPHETLLVADSLTGQDAVNVAKSFDDRIGITGIVLTRVDGDGRGGAALSMRGITGKPIKLIGMGEKLDELEDFHPDRIANRILDMGDVLSLVEKAAATIDADKAAKIAKKMQKGKFDLEDLSEQLNQMKKLGGMGSIMSMLPGVGKMKKQLDQANLDDSVFTRQQAIISSMTPKERRFPKVLNANRKKRIAAGSGTSVQEINKLIKMHRQMSDMMKKMNKGGPGGMGGMFGGGMPDISEEEMAAFEASGQMPEIPKDIEKLLPKTKPGLPGLGGLGGGQSGGFPGLPGLPGKKK